MPSLQEMNFIQGVSNESLKQAQDSAAADKYKQAAKIASEKFLSGDRDGAVAVMMQVDPQLTQNLMQGLGTQFNPKLQGEIAEATGQSLKEVEVMDESGKGTDVGFFNPRTGEVKKVGKGVSLNKPSASNRQTYQVRDPLTGEIHIIRRDDGQVVTTYGSPKDAVKAGEAESENEFDPKALYQSLNATERKRYNELTKDFFKDADADRDAILAGRKVKDLLASGKDLGADIVRVYQNYLSTATGDRGQRTEMDVKPFGGKADVLSKLERMITSSVDGKLPESDRQYLTDLAAALSTSAEQAVVDRANMFAPQVATNTKLTENQARTLLLQGMVSSSGSPKQAKPKGMGSTTSSAAKVKVISPNGKSGLIPKAQLEAAQAQGYKLAE